MKSFIHVCQHVRWLGMTYHSKRGYRAHVATFLMLRIEGRKPPSWYASM